ncbi:MAG: hypothetical protein N4A35_10510 [Flavobacteriales bacterium]|nr:hypothetical protein [Flavobacteriales bacterium]
MDNKKKYIILGASIILIVVVLFLVNSIASPNKEAINDKQKAKKTNDSTIVEEPFEKIPQKKINPNGTHFIYKLLERYHRTKTIQRIQTSYYTNLSEQLPLRNDNKNPNIYISVGESFNLESEDNDYLFDFVYEGNHAVIAFESLHNEFIEYILPNSTTPFYVEADTVVMLNFFHPSFKQQNDLELKNPTLNYHQLPKYKNWLVLNEEALNHESIEIAHIKNLSTICTKINYGKGSFIFHSIPDAFSNAFVATKDGKKHAEIIFSHLPEGNYYWHENYGKYSTYRGESNPEKLQKPKEFSRASPLQYILKVPALTIALVLSIIGLLLYMLIKSKRKQRIIPAVENNNNTSLEFIEVIAKLYQQQNRHDKIIKHIRQNFITFIKQRYYIQFNELDENTLQKIHLKSGIDSQLINDIFTDLSANKGQNISDQQLIELYQNIEYFYKNCI